MKILLLFPILVLVSPAAACGGRTSQLKSFLRTHLADELSIRDVSVSMMSSSISVSGRGRIRGLHRIRVKSVGVHTKDELTFYFDFKLIKCDYDSYTVTIGPDPTDTYYNNWQSYSEDAESFIRLYLSDDVITDVDFQFLKFYTFGKALRGKKLGDGELLRTFKRGLDDEVTTAIREELRRVLPGKSIVLTP